MVRQKYPNVKLVFAGQYDITYEDTWQQSQDLVEQFREHLIFLGEIDDAQVLANFYAACDVLALTSDTECFALVQVEAMLCGTPVVMTDTPGGRVPVTKTGMGKIAPMGDAQKIGEALLDVLDNPADFQKSYEEIDAIFNLQHTVDEYEATLRKAAESKSRRS